MLFRSVAEIGRTAMDLLFERLRNPDMATRKIVLSGRLVVRGSSAPRAGEAPSPAERTAPGASA